MNIIQLPSARVSEINNYILAEFPGHQGPENSGLLEGALGRIGNAIAYSGLDDVFLIASKHAMAIAAAHAFSDANKRTALAVCLAYLSLNGYRLQQDHELLADAIVDLVVGELTEDAFADILYSLWLSEQSE